MTDLSQFLNNDSSADDIAHTNGYANIAGGAGAGGLSMEERRKRLNQPRVIGQYKYSKLGQQGSSVKAKTADQKSNQVYDASSGTFIDEAAYSNRQANKIKDESQIDSKSIDRRQHFVEPPKRGYDKYS